MYGNAFGGTLAFALLSFERERFPFRRIAKKSNLFLQLSSTPHIMCCHRVSSILVFELKLLNWNMNITGYMVKQILVEYCSSGEDVSVNTVIILRNWVSILADLRSEATEEARIAPQFWGMMTVLTDISDPELLYSHCYHVNFCAKYCFFQF